MSESIIYNYLNVIYENRDKFANYYYYGCDDLDLIAVSKILDEGILAPMLWNQKNGFVTKKDDDSNIVKLVSFDNAFDEKNDSNSNGPFWDDIFMKLAVLVDKKVPIMDDDNIDYRYRVSPLHVDARYIKGLWIPSYYLDKRVGDLNGYPYSVWAFTWDYVIDWIAYLQNYFNDGFVWPEEIMVEFMNFASVVNEVFSGCTEYSIEKVKVGLMVQMSENKYNFLTIVNNHLQSLWDSKLGKIDATIGDVIDFVNRDRYPIYVMNESDIVRKKSLRR